ncbi:unnamed protein product, partial [Meganyctiphanes norvegica]
VLGENQSEPRFIQEPPSSVIFTNSTGATINCVTDGTPSTTITWTTHDGRPLKEIPGLVSVLNNGSMVFHGFPAQRYDTRLHDATYICTATSPRGALRATPTHVRA